MVSARMFDPMKIQENSQQDDTREFRQKKIASSDQDLGSRKALEGEEKLIWYPAEVDVSIRPGWFYHPKEDAMVRSCLLYTSLGVKCMYRLLIVDDEEDIRRGIARGIPWSQLGFEVAGQAGNGEEAVGLLESARPDVVLSDIRMPKMDGIELMQYLSANYPEIKIIILSGYNDVEYLNMAIKNRVTEYLLKPTDIDEFCQLFQNLKTRLDEEHQQKQEIEQLKAAVEQGRELSYDRVLINLLEGFTGGSTEQEWKREMEAGGMNFNHCVLAVLDKMCIRDRLKGQFFILIVVFAYVNVESVAG